VLRTPVGRRFDCQNDAVADRVRVFLSYRRADTQHVAGRVGDKLAEMFDLFMDIDTIPPGVDFTDFVRRAVGSCDVLLAFIGDRWLNLSDEHGRRRIDDPADWVAEELRVALGRGVRVIPVLVESAAMPLAGELPEPLRPLVNRQALPLRHSSFSADLARLIAGIEHVHAGRAAAPPGSAALPHPSSDAQPAEPYADRWDTPASHPGTTPPMQVPVRIPARSPSRRPVIIGIVVLLVAALAGVAWATLRSASDPGSTPTLSTGPTIAATPTPSAAGSKTQPARTIAQLRSRIPPSFNRTCQKLEPTSAVLRASLLVATQCVPSQGDTGGKMPVYSFYFSYSSPDAATTAYRAYYAPGSLPAGDCTSEPAEMSYRRDGTSGTLRCYEDPEGYRVFAWISDDLGIVASAADQTMSYAELAAWWQHAGPVG
jgi:hypothetical protein